MTWARVEDVPARAGSFRGRKGTSTTTKALTVWRCDGCRALACGPANESPGRCLKRGCRFFSGK